MSLSNFVQLSFGRVPQSVAMKYEALRLSSIQAYPRSLPYPATDFANAGFFYYGEDDKMECYSCGFKVKGWGYNEDPLAVHRKLSPNCLFLCDNDGNKIMASQALIPDMSRVPGSQVARFPTILHSDSEVSTTSSNYSSGYGSMPRSQSSVSSTNQSHRGLSNISENYLNQSGSSIQNPHHNGQLAAQNENRLFASSNVLTSLLHGAPTNQNQTNSITQGQLPNLESARPNNLQGQTPLIPKTSEYGYGRLQRQNQVATDYRYESSRLRTFINWPANAAITPEELASSGFCYTGSDDRVQCHFCKGILRNWETDDVPDAEHRRHFSQCPFICHPQSVGNVAIIQENYILTGGHELVDGVVMDKPIHAQFSLPIERLTTFTHAFEAKATQKPDNLVQAGFFYTGESDHVKCYYCDGGLRNWKPNDDPWTEHARWFPRCQYLRQCKGESFIKDIQSRFSVNKSNKRPIRKTRSKTLKHHVDPQLVQKYMRHRLVSVVMEMGYDRDSVKQVVIIRIQDLGDEFFPNVESLVDAVTEYEEMKERKQLTGDESDGSIDTPNTEERAVASAEVVTSDEVISEQTPIDIYNYDKLLVPEHYDVAQITEAIRELKDERLCKVCMDADVDVVFLKCGHLVCCSGCAPSLRHCCICREVIRGTIRVFET